MFQMNSRGAVVLAAALAWIAGASDAGAQVRQARILLLASASPDSINERLLERIAAEFAKYPDFVVVGSEPDRIIKVLTIPLDDSTDVVSWVFAFPATEPGQLPQLIHHQLEWGELDAIVSELVDLVVRAIRKSLEAEAAAAGASGQT